MTSWNDKLYKGGNTFWGIQGVQPPTYINSDESMLRDANLARDKYGFRVKDSDVSNDISGIQGVLESIKPYIRFMDFKPLDSVEKSTNSETKIIPKDAKLLLLTVYYSYDDRSTGNSAQLYPIEYIRKNKALIEVDAPTRNSICAEISSDGKSIMFKRYQPSGYGTWSAYFF